MKKYLPFLTAAALALGGVALLVRAEGPGQPRDRSTPEMSGGTTRPAGMHGALPPGIEASRNADDTQIRQTFANAVNAALTKDKFGNIADYLAQPRPVRLGDLAKIDSDSAISKIVAQINKDWRKKYYGDLKATAAAFGPNVQDVQIAMGEITNPTLLSNWPIENNPGANRNENRDENRMENRDENRAASGNDAELKGTNVAIVTFPADQVRNLPEVKVSMVHDGGKWKIAIPSNIDDKMLHDNVVREFTSFEKASWPSDQHQAYRIAAHHLVAALYNVRPGEGGHDEAWEEMDED